MALDKGRDLEAPLQTELPTVWGSPQGEILAPAGFICVDRTTGNLWIKVTREIYDTGWVNLTGIAYSISIGNIRFTGDGKLQFRNPDTGLYHTLQPRGFDPDIYHEWSEGQA